MKKTCNSSVTHNPPVEGRQLELFNHTGNQRKPQIETVPSVSPKQRNRYRVVLGDQILGDRLTIDEALKLAKRGVKW